MARSFRIRSWNGIRYSFPRDRDGYDARRASKRLLSVCGSRLNSRAFDGRTFVMVKNEAESTRLNLGLGWTEETENASRRQDDHRQERT
jgi:hypothetical protein